MVVLGQFYQITEKKTSKVSSFWKVIHTLTCVTSAICGFLTAFTFGRVLSNFNYNCILNSKVKFDNSTFLNVSTFDGVETVRAIDLTDTFWGPVSDCNFTQFTPLVVMISSVVWAIFFAVMSKGGGGYKTDLLSSPWGIIYPSIFFTIILLITYIISSLKLKHGIVEFCNQFKPELNNTGCVPAIDVYRSQFHDKIDDVLFYQFYPNIHVCVLTSDIGMWSWVFHLVICVARVLSMADFDIQLVTVMSKEEEQIEKIVELDVHDHTDETSEV